MNPDRRDFLKLAAGAAVLASLPLQHCLAAMTGKLSVAAPLGLPQVILARALQDPDVNARIPERELRNWRTPDQLRAWLARGEVGLSATPTNVAANLYNRGVPIVLMNVNIWGTLGMLGLPASGPLTAVENLAGKHIGIPWRGDMPDLVFRFLIRKAGLEVDRDLRVTYQSSPLETVQMFVAQRLDAAVLPEPVRTAARLQAGQFGQKPEELDLQEEWGRLTGQGAALPQAGVICRRDLLEADPQALEVMQSAIGRAVSWVTSEPAKAATLGAELSPLAENVYQGAIPRTQMVMMPASKARPELEAFLTALAELSPDFIGGRLPDTGFYLPDAVS
ncbi:ABC transporter substrate-binding protein [Marinobacter oulmenensis]|uniref:NitT/TauT family transport system substrate-binding protein n=1 Tax=Marinobacter oulmenensis TaxID=643747 RepID=A0A840U4M2_9GAMM|nr:ABC transporter substrate-binding protein [Marinobacter oulmenensis]MBB5320079.1 NitT/TauT family transport system substrate-binding protein [Marinobacter oulmenensis]